MRESKTLTELYQIANRHEFGDITLLIENQSGKLRGKFILHTIEADRTILEKTLVEKGLPPCFGRPPAIVEADVVSSVVWDERYRSLGDIIPLIEKEVVRFSHTVGTLGDKLAMCATCPVFERCYRIAEFNLQRKSSAAKTEIPWAAIPVY